jgi:aldose 1-epimerase
MSDATPIFLSCGTLRAEIRPDIGGSLARFWSEDADGPVDWMRRPSGDQLDTADARGMACYPLVPFSNRIRNGRFRFQGRDVALPLNHAPHPHVLHGHGWQAPWQVVDASDTGARLRYRHDAGAWPWPYRAEQSFTLEQSGLKIAISITNIGDDTMPAGIGLHPYFHRDPDTTIAGHVVGLWESDREVMPTRLVPADTIWPAGAPLDVDRVNLDNCFTKWAKSLDIGWPSSGRGLRISARGPLDFLIVFSPPGERFFCAEPVSHCIDAFNLAAERNDTGTVSLAPGETLEGEVSFRPNRAG